MAHKPYPKLILFAGANGSGKTTLAEKYLPYAKVKEFVNADSIAKGLSPLNPDSQKIKAGKLALLRTRELIGKGEDFAIETTLSGVTLAKILKEAKEKNYQIRLFYFCTTDVRINIKRIKLRVKQGGHHVPSEDVKRRYKGSLYNLFHLYFGLCDIISIDDTSGDETGLTAPVRVITKIGNDILYDEAKKSVWDLLKKKAGWKDGND
jgi:predicted ABC-type ATPase